MAKSVATSVRGQEWKGVPQGRYKPSFLFGACPHCIGGTLYRTFTRESYSCFNCGYVDSLWARHYLAHPVSPTITVEEIVRMTPRYAIPDRIEQHKQDIMHDLPILGLSATMEKYGMSHTTWYNVKREWTRTGTTFPDLRVGSGSRGRTEPVGIAARVGNVSSDGKMIPVSSLLRAIGVEEKEVSRTLESGTWSSEVSTFLQSKLAAYRLVKEMIEGLARKE